MFIMNLSCLPDPISPASSRTLVSNTRRDLSISTISTLHLISAPTGDAAVCFMSKYVPTVLSPSPKKGCVHSNAVFSISIIIAGVANTGIAPLTIDAAVLLSVTVVVPSFVIPTEIMIPVKPIR